MKTSYRNIILYLFIVILPTISGSLYYLNDRDQRENDEKLNHAKWIASIHETHWDQFISETVTSLKMLSLVTESLQKTPEQMKPLLTSAAYTDPRYGGLYLLDSHGNVVSGSNSSWNNPDLSKESYIKEVIKTKDIVISNYQETLENDYKVIGLATPVLDANKNLQYIIVAKLRVDYIQNIMKVLTPETNLLITNGNNEVILNLNATNSLKTNQEDWVTLPINRLPWSIKVKMSELDKQAMIQDSLLVFILIYVITQVLFLVVKYFILKRETAKEKRQNEAQKLELVGTLAASTAHEIRNPLTGIKGLVQLLSEKYQNQEDQFYFSVINEEIKRINQIVSEFLILGKPTAQKMEELDLCSIIQDLQPLISSEANLYNVSWNCSLPTQPVYVLCTKDQMKQVILNITKNALESMEHGGQLTIKLDQLENHCSLTISDTGIGIEKEMLDKIFNPFYTSKDTGTGLGLVVCKRIVNSFGGKIIIKSQHQKGTNVMITLPIHFIK